MTPDRSIIRAGAILAASVFLDGCDLSVGPVTSYKELEGCVLNWEPGTTGNLPRESLSMQTKSKKVKVTTIGYLAPSFKEQFSPGDRIVLKFTKVDTSLMPTSRERRKKQQSKELEDMIVRSREFVLIDTPEASTRAQLIEKTSSFCTG